MAASPSIINENLELLDLLFHMDDPINEKYTDNYFDEICKYRAAYLANVAPNEKPSHGYDLNRLTVFYILRILINCNISFITARFIRHLVTTWQINHIKYLHNNFYRQNIYYNPSDPNSNYFVDTNFKCSQNRTFADILAHFHMQMVKNDTSDLIDLVSYFIVYYFLRIYPMFRKYAELESQTIQPQSGGTKGNLDWGQAEDDYVDDEGDDYVEPDYLPYTYNNVNFNHTIYEAKMIENALNSANAFVQTQIAAAGKQPSSLFGSFDSFLKFITDFNAAIEAYFTAKDNQKQPTLQALTDFITQNRYPTFSLSVLQSNMPNLQTFEVQIDGEKINEFDSEMFKSRVLFVKKYVDYLANMYVYFDPFGQNADNNENIAETYQQNLNHDRHPKYRSWGKMFDALCPVSIDPICFLRLMGMMLYYLINYRKAKHIQKQINNHNDGKKAETTTIEKGSVFKPKKGQYQEDIAAFLTSFPSHFSENYLREICQILLENVVPKNHFIAFPIDWNITEYMINNYHSSNTAQFNPTNNYRYTKADTDPVAKNNAVANPQDVVKKAQTDFAKETDFNQAAISTAQEQGIPAKQAVSLLETSEPIAITTQDSSGQKQIYTPEEIFNPDFSKSGNVNLNQGNINVRSPLDASLYGGATAIRPKTQKLQKIRDDINRILDASY